MSKKSTVIVVESDGKLRTWIEKSLVDKGLHVRCYADPHELLAEYNPDLPGCLVLAINLPAMSGIDLYRQLAVRCGHHPVVMIGNDVDVKAAIAAMRLGAVDVIHPPLNAKLLIDRVRVALQEDVKIRRRRQQEKKIAARAATLTARESEIMNLVVRGNLTKQIASHLGIRPKTVDVHRSRIMKKMGVASVAELVRLVLQFDASYRAEFLSGQTTSGPREACVN